MLAASHRDNPEDPMAAPTVRFAALLAACLLLVPPAFAGQASVAGQVVTSTAFPVGTIAVDPAFRHIGSKEFVLYGVANCEIHLFAEVEGRQVKRHYWIQFEGYLPEKPNHTYDYSKDPQAVEIGGHRFHERIFFGNVEESKARRRPGSDSEAVAKLFEEKGLVVGPDVMQIRLVRLDETRRKELMVIYSESLALQGFTAKDLAPQGRAAADREKLYAALRQRAAAGLKVAMP